MDDKAKQAAQEVRRAVAHLNHCIREACGLGCVVKLDLVDVGTMECRDEVMVNVQVLAHI